MIGLGSTFVAIAVVVCTTVTVRTLYKQRHEYRMTKLEQMHETVQDFEAEQSGVDVKPQYKLSYFDPVEADVEEEDEDLSVKEAIQKYGYTEGSDYGDE